MTRRRSLINKTERTMTKKDDQHILTYRVGKWPIAKKDDVWTYRRVNLARENPEKPVVDEDTGARIPDRECVTASGALLATAPWRMRVIAFFYLNFLRLRGHGLNPFYWWWIFRGKP